MHGCCIKGLVTLKVTIFGEEATSALAGFHASPLSWNLEMLAFHGADKTIKTRRKTLTERREPTNKINPYMAPDRQNWIRITLVGGEHSHHYANSDPQILFPEDKHISFMIRESREFADVQFISVCTLTILNVAVILLQWPAATHYLFTHNFFTLLT